MGIFDLHVDSIIQQRLFRYDLRRKHRRGIRGQPFFWHADIPRMIEADYEAACLGIHYYPWESKGGLQEMSTQLDYLDRIAGEDSRLLRVREVSDWTRARETGKLAIAPGVEGAHMLNGRIEAVKILKERRVAYLTLAHFSANSAATPSVGRGANERDGLTAFGRRLVEELNRTGVAVDLAHVNTPGTLQAAKLSSAPVFCTHTGVKGVYDHPRNISDAEIDGIAETGGVIGVIFAPIYLAGKLFADSEVALDHLDYIVERVGVDHVALGSDYDGWLPTILSDHRDCRDIFRILEGLKARGYTEEEIEKITALNAFRVLQCVAEKGQELSS